MRELSEPFAHIPHTATTIVLRAEQGGRREALVLGPRTRATYSVAKAPASCVRLRLAPGAANPMLGVAASELTDRVVRLADMPGPAGELADELRELPHEEILAFLEHELPQRLSENATQRAHRGLLIGAAAALAEPTGRSIPAVAADLAVSERHKFFRGHLPAPTPCQAPA